MLNDNHSHSPPNCNDKECLGANHEHEHHHRHRHGHNHEHHHGHGHVHHTPGTNMSEEKDISTEKNTVGSTASRKQHHHHDHGHSHEHLDHPGRYEDRPTKPFTSANTTTSATTTTTTFYSSSSRDYSERAFTVGLGGPVGSGKTALMLALCKKLRDALSICAVTNDIFTREDGEFLTRNHALEKEWIVAVETGGCPHAAIREDISANLHACEQLTAKFDPVDIILLESGGDNLAANFSNELADFTIYVIDVAGGDKVPRKGGPGVTQSDVLVINKTDLASAVGADLVVMKRDAKRMRGEGPTVFAQAREGLGLGVDEIVELVLDAWRAATKSTK